MKPKPFPTNLAAKMSYSEVGMEGFYVYFDSFTHYYFYRKDSLHKESSKSYWSNYKTKEQYIYSICGFSVFDNTIN